MFTHETALPVPEGGLITAAAMSTASLPALAWCAFDAAAWQAELHQRWQLPLPAGLQHAAVRRKAEYLASRWLVQQQLATLGHAGFVLGNAPDRSPCWPAGLQASLSHSHGCAVMAATSAPLCVGIDVEHIMCDATVQETAELLMQPAERALLAALPLPFAQAATLLFSLKESLYKALWPQLHQPMDFHQATLTAVDPGRQCASLRLTQRFSPDFTPHTPLQARFWLSPQRVITLLTHPLPQP
ncbi:4'-phosphopantetheinyl transferase superfamily protein [Candidatus Pantoea soli]|uniref:Enterobactin synthase component D n=1 Tax=Candidatus Pantoea soli TaxID=3098669 RepID=A0A518XE41_9GAMM|nr:4'-phosphopantetheinyl transferase superfamily protein [Pantoea soli]